jgi:hypothetical protein
MRKLSHGFLLFLLLMSLRGITQSKESVREFVSRHYIHGMPYDQAQSYGKQAIPELLAMLQDQSVQQYWPNIVMTLGYIGDASAAGPLIKFMESSYGELSLEKFRTILRVFQALGHMSQSGNPELLKVLREYTSLNSWRVKNLRFSYNQYKGAALSEVLARQAIVGLGISGRVEANARLKELTRARDTRKDWSDNLAEAIMLNDRVNREGAKKVFGKPSI